MLTLPQMSLYGGIFIVTVILLRALAVNRLPKKVFVLLWDIALLRLLLPFRFSSPVSIYSALNPLVARMRGPLPFAALLPDRTAPSARIPFFGSALPEDAAQAGPGLSPLALVWFSGMLLLALAFLLTHLKSRRIYACSLPVKQPFVEKWLEANRPRRRPVQIRCSDRTESPLTYGFLWPVVLLPKHLAWEDEETLGYILAHEMAHIRRFDALVKWLYAAVACIHWFNPAVWAMYTLANRDFELSCDEAVLRRYGLDARSSYALTLVAMEECRTCPAPLASSFSKNALKERITAIMTARSITPAAAAAAVVITAVITLLFAPSAPADAALSGLSGANDSAVSLSLSEYTLPPAAGEPSYSQKDYDRVADALFFEGWESMSIAAYNRRINAVFADEGYEEDSILYLYDRLCSALPEKDPLSSYLKDTVSQSLSEYAVRTQEAFSGNRVDPEYMDCYSAQRDWEAENAASISYVCYRFSYRILDQERLTVAQRDSFLQEIILQARDLLQEKRQSNFSQKEFEEALKRIGAHVSTDKIAFTGCFVETYE